MKFWQKIFKRERKEEKQEAPAAAVETISLRPRGGEAAKQRVRSGVLIFPRLTEKATALGKTNAYVFSIDGQANKIGVKRAVEGLWGVTVERVRILNMPGKERRRGRQIGWKPGFKKAIVKVKEGQTIEMQ